MSTLRWHEETMRIINTLTPDIKGKAFNLDWFLLRQRFEEAERLMGLNQWQPITTAPKDGTVVMLGATGIVEVGYWQDLHEAETECGAPVECDVDEGWYGSLDIWPSGKQPTHWMPLPLPPANTKAVTNG